MYGPCFLGLVGRTVIERGRPDRTFSVQDVTRQAFDYYVRLLPNSGPAFTVRLDTFRANYQLSADVISLSGRNVIPFAERAAQIKARRPVCTAGNSGDVA